MSTSSNPSPANETSVKNAPEAAPATPGTGGGGGFNRESRWLLAGVIGLLGLFAALAMKRTPSATRGGDARARVERVTTATGAEGLTACPPGGGSCLHLGAATSVPDGSRIKTDFATRAELRLADGSRLRMERGSELLLDSGDVRGLRLERGSVEAELVRAKTPFAIELAFGRLSSDFSKLLLRAAKDAVTVDVLRGSVRIEDTARRALSAHSGEQARLTRDGARVTPTPVLGSALGNGEALERDAGTRGLGELRARKPGSRDEMEGAVHLASHVVRVRIAGALARTEIEEVFENTSNETLEGIYRFPIPPDAKLERLALDVDGKLVDGAFVDRERAAAIFRGAIAQATPKDKKPLEEIIWVPGPWKDPALLEWQRGGRFELRIFPIPRRASRRVVLTYTELVPVAGELNHYTYPLAPAASGRRGIDNFSIDVQVRGHDANTSVQALGYEPEQRSEGGRTTLAYSARNFQPNGDFGVAYALPNADAELRAWAYVTPQGDAPTLSRDTNPRAPALDVNSPYVALTLRPRLPAGGEGRPSAFAVVVDSSRSMFGESYQRARRLAARIVTELEPDDRVVLLACDSECRSSDEALSGGDSGGRAAERFLSQIDADGASDPTQALARAADALSRLGEREGRIIYLGDGAPTVGPILPSHIESEVARTLPADRLRVTAVAIGPTADNESLGALARGGGGVLVRYSPGEGLAEAAFAALGASYGRALRDVSVTLPEGVFAIAPQRLDAIPAGGQILLVARTTERDVTGDVILRGRLGSRDFERRYPLRIAATSDEASAFVPRLYAGLRITDLERDGSGEAKAEVLGLSTRFNVGSRYTSLLVLESEAMFRAFGLERDRSLPGWTGEEVADSTTSESEEARAEELDSALGSAPGGRAGGSGRARALDAQDEAKAEADAPMARKSASLGELSLEGSSAGPRTAAPAKAPAPAAAAPRADDGFAPPPPPAREPLEIARDRRPRNMVPMRRIWERSGEISSSRLVPKNASFEAIATAERKSLSEPDRREPVRKLYAMFALAGDTIRAERLVERWSSRDPLDADALTARADLAARRGDRARAIRLLGSVIDARPGDAAAARRLERLERWSNRPHVGCRYLVAAAELGTGQAKLVADAVRCSRASGDGLAERELFAAAPESVRRAAENLLAAPAPDDGALTGDLRVEASWSEDVDVDIGIVDPEGRRVSFLGAPTRAVISARDVTSTRREALALRGAAAGDYVVEVVRGEPSTQPVHGELTITVAGTTRRVPFTLTREQTTVALASVKLTPRLVPVAMPAPFIAR